MLVKSAIAESVSVLTRRIRLASGVFAPGHLGELTQVVPFELVDAVLAESGRTERRLRLLPSRVGVYFVLALGMFPQVGAVGVWAKLTGAFAALGPPAPSEKALRDLRRRLGVAPLQRLFEVLAGPLAQPTTPGVRFGRLRTVAFDGCTSIKVPDTAANVTWLGKLSAALGVTGYPALELVTLVETGTRSLLGAVFGPPRAATETEYASRLLHLLKPDMLLLDDRGFDTNAFLTDVAATGAQFLVRLRNHRRLPVLAKLDDGSYLSRLGDLPVRIIDAHLTVTCADGTRYTGSYRLATTLTRPRRHDAKHLAALYHERWEHEVAYLALRHTLLEGRVLRSKDPIGLHQEIWALLALYQALRHAMVTAIETVPGTDPDRAGFTTALQTARDLTIRAENVIPDHADLAGDIGRAVLAHLLPPRRPRTSVRRVKSPLSRYNKADPHRPRISTPITSINTTIQQPQGARSPQLPTGLTNAPEP